MTVQELIKELEKLPQHYEIRTEDITGSYDNTTSKNDWIVDIKAYENDFDSNGEVVLYYSE